VKRAFGGVAGLLAALMLALVPVSVVVGRDNTIDSLLVFTLLVAVWTCLKATERGSLSWLLATGAVVGLGFEIKMLEAYLVVPALGLVYLLGAPVSRRARVAHLALASAVLLVVSFAWPLAVDLTPATLRPWMDSTQDNSAISLALGYNGIDRLLGMRGSVTQFLSGLGIRLPGAGATGTSAAGLGGGGMFNNGPAGPLRLLDQQLAGQASWLLPLALVGIGLAGWRAIRNRLAFVHSRQGQAAIVFGTWLLAAGAFFSVANFFHSYYLVTLGPPIAALAAMGVWGAWRDFRAHSRAAWLLPSALVGTALVQAHILGYYPTWSRWLTPVAVAGAALGSAVLLYALIRDRLQRNSVIVRAAAGLAVGALLVAPVVWSGYSTLNGSSFGLPAAGPQGADASGGFGGPRGIGGPSGFGGPSGTPGGGGADGSVSGALVSYLEANQGSATYLVATPDSHTASSIILASGGKPVMSLGGFSGSDPILTVDQFAQLVRSGRVRYVLLGGGFGGFGRGPQGSSTNNNASIRQWVQANGTPVPGSAIGNAGGSQTQLYDLSGLQGAVA
jgi:4-amino-4-deoxy-L-arabinose transferase-like glycosyltransferase